MKRLLIALAALLFAWPAYAASLTPSDLSAQATLADSDLLLTWPAVGPGPLSKMTWLDFKTNVIAGLGTAAQQDTGTSGAKIPFLNGTNSWSGVNSFTAQVAFKASSTSSASFNIAPGVAPTSPINGDCWLTSAAHLCRVGGATQTYLYSGGALGTPSSAALTNATGLPIATGVSGLGTGVAAFLATPSSANLATAVTNETGSGALVFGTSPTLTTPNLGTPSAITLTSGTGLPISTGVSGLGTGVAAFLATPSSANLATAMTDETGSGANVFGTSPTIATPTLNGTPTLGSASGWRTALGLGTLALLNGSVNTSWTPTVAFTTAGTSSWSYSNQLGRWGTVAGLQWAFFFVQATPTIGTASGSFVVNLPFTCANVQFMGGNVTLNGTGWTWPASRTQVVPNLNSTTKMEIGAIGTAATMTAFGPTNMTGGALHTITGMVFCPDS